MALRTYFWDTRTVSRYQYLKRSLQNKNSHIFKYGNAGDIFNKDLIKYLYKQTIFNTRNEGCRILMLGSLASVIKEGDIINGIGWKGNNLDTISSTIESATVYGVRGPLTKELFEKHHADLSKLKFELDPGLLVKEVYNLKTLNNTEKQVVFIPHYNDEAFYKNNYPKPFKIIKADNKPVKLIKEIMKAKVVYTSSLHGIIFSHALSKPCVFVSPQSAEPIFKYQDYFLSVGLNMPKPLKNIFETNFILDTQTYLDKSINFKDFYFPDEKELRKKGIIF